MSLKEMIKMEKEEMTPLRRRFNYVIYPACLVVCAVLLITGGVLMSMDAARFLPVFLVLMGVIIIVLGAMLLSSFVLAEMELEIELKKYAYIFEDAKPLAEETVTVKDREGGLIYTLMKDGLKIRFPDTEEAVFDETQENVKFLSWSDAELVAATDNRSRRVWLAIDVIDVSGRSVNAEDYEEEMYFLPVTEDVYAAVVAFGLENNVGGDWCYIRYNPKDAFKQILRRGYVREMINKKTGEMFVDADGNFVGEIEETESSEEKEE